MKHNINFDWNYIRGFYPQYIVSTFNGEKVDIPHTVKEVPYNYFDEKCYQCVSTYEKYFDIDEDITDKIVILRFEAFMLKATIYVNGECFGSYTSGYVPVEVDVTNFVRRKNNRLIVVLDSSEDKNVPPFGFVVDYLTYGGIYREVSVNVHPKTYLKNIFVHADMNGNVKLEFTQVGRATLDYTNEILDNNQVVASFKTLEYKLENPSLWTLNQPKLYTLRTTIKSNDGEEVYINKFGFRNVDWKEDGFYLNNEHIKLIGLNRHQSYPIIGYAASKSLQEVDAYKLKYEAGVNVVRTSHYPDSVHFLNKCDEIGLLLINEVPGWQHIGASKEWKDNFFNYLEKMIIEQRNHPCVIAHGVRIDESKDDHELYSKANEMAHKLDPYTKTIGVRNFMNSELLEDIYGYNDFINWSLDAAGLDDPAKQKTASGKPYLITENMGHMCPTKGTSDTPLKRDHALRHLLVLNDAFKYERVAGEIGWCFVDYHTHASFGSGDRICAHGVFDMYRNKKPAYASFASQQDSFPVMELLSIMKPGEFPSSLFGPLYIATNCDYVELYRNKEFINKFYPVKEERFANLKHPPILVDDLIGNSFKEEKIAPKYYPTISKMLSFAAFNGYGALTTKMKLFLLKMMKKYKISFDELVDLWNKYIGSWGGEAKFFTFKGYKNGQVVKEVTYGPCTKFDLEVKCYKDHLKNEETYDTALISLNYVDDGGVTCPYANKVVHIETSGPIKLIGDANQALLGGQLSIMVRSLNEVGEGKVKITLEDIVKEIRLVVR